MKVAELREKLAKLPKDEIIKIAVECYKLVPKAKKEDNDLDAFIENPTKKKSKQTARIEFQLYQIEADVAAFIENAKEQNYLYPNQVVSKKERPKWRFKVKRWYKELVKRNRPDKNLELQAKLLTDLYGIISDAKYYSYFSTNEPFRSVGIEQDEFFEAVMMLIEDFEGKVNFVDKGINLLYNHGFSFYSLGYLPKAFVKLLTVPDLKYKAIEKVEKLLASNGFVPPKSDKKNVWRHNTNEYRREERNNNLTKLGFRLYASLCEYEEAITFFNKHYYDQSPEVALYVLVDLLFEEKLKDEICQVIEQAQKDGVKPRKSLITLLNTIKNDNELPAYF